DKSPRYLWDIIKNESEYIASFPMRTMLLMPPDEEKQLTDAVFTVQSKLVSKLDIKFRSKLEYFKEGRLIGFLVGASFNDGVAEFVSDGYFNLVNYPPYCTWLYYIEDREIDIPSYSHLIAWIPPEFVDVAIAGLEVDASECLFLLNDENFHASYKPALEKISLLV
ncbi:MAG: hypothetical protein AAF846_27770, partial [Chloroflexota bacterium]